MSYWMEVIYRPTPSFDTQKAYRELKQSPTAWAVSGRGDIMLMYLDRQRPMGISDTPACRTFIRTMVEAVHALSAHTFTDKSLFDERLNRLWAWGAGENTLTTEQVIQEYAAFVVMLYRRYMASPTPVYPPSPSSLERAADRIRFSYPTLP